MPSFDIELEPEMPHVDNAINNLMREVKTRYDFKNIEVSVTREESILTLFAPDEFKLNQVIDLLIAHCTRQGVESGFLDTSAVEEKASGGVRKKVVLRCGIDKPLAKKVTQSIKDLKLKVQPSIDGEKVRVTGKNRDDLQAVMTHVKGAFNEPFSYENFRD